MDSKIKMGDKVRLKTGGPEMEAGGMWRDDSGKPTKITCYWKVDREPHMFDYPAELLEVIS